VLKISSAFTPPPPEGFVSPMTWGVESHVLDRFGQAGVATGDIAFERGTFRFRIPDKSPAEVIELFRRFYGPTMNAFEAAERNGMTDELQRQLVALAESQNTDTSGGTDIAATFLQVTVTL